MRYEYWNKRRECWMPSDMDRTPEEIAELNGALGWEMYREAE